MALTIKSSPILYGESAREFIEAAAKNNELPTPRLSPSEEEMLREEDRKSREFEKIIFERIHASQGSL